MKPRHSKLILLCISLSTVAVFFQNCGQAGDIQLVSTEMPGTLKNGGTELPRSVPEIPLYTPPTSQPPVVSPPVVETPPNIPSNIPPVSSGPPMKVSELKGYICEPFKQSSESTSGRNGLKGSLRYVTPGSDSDSDPIKQFAKELGAKEYWTSSDSRVSKYENPIFFKDIAIKPVGFTEGFSYADGKYLENGKQEKLVEWFSVKYETVLTLSDSDPVGYYKLATISDDGTIIEADLSGNGTMTRILGNDGIHAPRFQCQNRNSYLHFPSKETKIKVNIYFYQGPRMHIANVLIFKHVGSSAPVNVSSGHSDVLGCELNGSEKIFDGYNDIAYSPTSSPNGGLKPMGGAAASENPDSIVVSSEFAYLLKNGWRVVPNRNFLLPDGEVDPCSVNSLTIDSTLAADSVIAGTKSLVDKKLSFKFVTSLASEHVVKLYDITGGAEIFINNPALGASTVVNGKNVHTFEFGNIDINKKYRMEVVVMNSDLNISKRTDYKIEK